MLFRVVVSVLTVADSGCRLAEIGNVAQATGGHVCSIFSLSVRLSVCLFVKCVLYD